MSFFEQNNEYLETFGVKVSLQVTGNYAVLHRHKMNESVYGWFEHTTGWETYDEALNIALRDAKNKYLEQIEKLNHIYKQMGDVI